MRRAKGDNYKREVVNKSVERRKSKEKKRWKGKRRWRKRRNRYLQYKIY